MMKVFAFSAVLLASIASAAEQPTELKTPTGTIHGTLLVPDTAKPPMPIVLLIAGSGPTDRNGNSAALPGRNDSLKMLAEGLAAKGIASLRYDKRGIAESRSAMTAEKNLRFETYIDDAVAWAKRLKKDPRFSKVVVVGHSEGALIGAVAAQKSGAAGYVSIAGLARPADLVIRGQLMGKLPPDLRETSDKILEALKYGNTIDDVPPSLAALYRPSVQPYLISWFRYDPLEQVKKLTIPVLIVQGTTDIQVSVDDARALAAAKPEAKLEIIEGMNHVMKKVEMDQGKQVASYGDPSLPVDPRLVDAIVGFVLDVAARR